MSAITMGALGTELSHALRPPLNSDRAVREVLDDAQREALRAALGGRALALCFGAGVDSTAMLVALRCAGLRPDVITMADTGGEKRLTWDHVARMGGVLSAWNWPQVDVCRAVTRPSTGYSDLYGNCIANETLPSLAFGMKSCSIRWKAQVQDQWLRGVRSGPNARAPHPLWTATRDAGTRITKLIGYDCGKADLRAIAQALGADMVPIKSACFFCPASKAWELWWLAAQEPDLFERALYLERNALTGRHSRFDAVAFGATWDDLVRNAESFPSTSTCVGLGRSFSWNQWARVNCVVDDDFRVVRARRDHFLAMSEALRAPDNALDARSVKPVRIPIKRLSRISS